MKQINVMRVLIVDDHPIMRVGIAAIINAQAGMQVVGQAGTAAAAVKLYTEVRPDVTLMDLRLPDHSGVEAIRQIRAQDASARMIVLTTYEGDEDIHQALGAGALGYLIKGMPHELLLKALVRVHAGHRYLPGSVSDTLLSRVPGTNLSQREQEVLQLMFRGRTNQEIGEALCIKETTVKTHVSVILMRLGVTDRTQAVVEGLKRGLIHL